MAAPSAGFREAQRLLSWEKSCGTLQLAAHGPGCWQSWEGCPDPQPFILRPFAGPLTLCFLPLLVLALLHQASPPAPLYPHVLWGVRPMSQPSTVRQIFQCDELPGQSLSISSEEADVLEERAVQMPATGAKQVGNRQMQTAPAQGKHWDPTTRTGWLGPHRLTDGNGDAALA